MQVGQLGYVPGVRRSARSRSRVKDGESARSSIGPESVGVRFLLGNEVSGDMSVTKDRDSLVGEGTLGV